MGGKRWQWSWFAVGRDNKKESGRFMSAWLSIRDGGQMAKVKDTRPTNCCASHFYLDNWLSLHLVAK